MFEIDPAIEKASTPPAAFYRDPEAFAAAREKVFVRSWQLVADTDSLKAPGSLLPFTLLPGMLDEPLLIVRGQDDQIRCLSNVCTHRGNIVCEGPGVANSLRCRYHGRRFGLDGKFHFMPEFDGVEGFPSPADDLPSVPIEPWSQFLFVSPDPVAPLEEVLRPVSERVGFLPVDNFRFRPERSRDYLVRAHWALYVENYLEGFHIPYIHASLNEALDYGSYETHLFDHSNLQIGIARGAEHVFDLPSGHPDHGKSVSAFYFWVFPNLMLNFYPWGLSVNIFRPIAPDQTKVSFLCYVGDESKLGQGAGAELDRVEREDEAVVERVQQGIRSRFYDRGRYSPLREQGTHHFHRLLSRALNA
ncbi:MAG: aromatic ring-hydroxylating dioxygenase subunit alpha [Fimbriimonadaceae bacterium]